MLECRRLENRPQFPISSERKGHDAIGFGSDPIKEKCHAVRVYAVNV
jgi:hypothetical protein